MNELKESLKIKSFIINSGIIKNITKLNITLDEFILMLYFINIENKLNLELINKYTGFDNGHILELFNSVLTKGFIEVRVVEIAPNKQDEEVSLDVFYDKLIMSAEEENPKENEKVSLDVFDVFEQEFGRTLSPMEYEQIKGWIESGITPELIKEALKEAVLSGVATIRYIGAILREWSKNGGKKPIRKKENNEKEYNELFDYDWLE
jgi:DNA replication protein